MHLGEIERLIFKNIFGHATDMEKERLNGWLGESAQNRKLYGKLRSMPFLERAITDDNRLARRRGWENIVRQTSAGKRHLARRRAMRVAAAVIVPLIVGLAWFAADRLTCEGDGANMINILPGSRRVMVTLSNGEQMMFGESEKIAVMRGGTTTLVNEDNTISLTTRNYEPAVDEYIVYKIPRGGEYAVKLPDGTVVHMNSESELRVPVKFDGTQRTIYFTGEGYFNVAKDPLRHFVVKTGLAAVEVLGTKFNVRAYDDEECMYTTLVEGAVDIIGGRDSRVSISPGTQAEVNGKGGIVVREVDTYPYVAWTSGRIVFDNARTEDIMKVLRRWYNCEVFYGDDAVKERRFTMDILKYDDITEILALMSKVNVRCTIKGNDVHLSSK